MTPTTLERPVPGVGSAARATSAARDGAAHRVVRNTLFNLAAQGLYAAFYLVVIASLARGLGKEGFGQYYMLFALMLVVQVVCEAGVSTLRPARLWTRSCASSRS